MFKGKSCLDSWVPTSRNIRKDRGLSYTFARNLQATVIKVMGLGRKCDWRTGLRHFDRSLKGAENWTGQKGNQARM